MTPEEAEKIVHAFVMGRDVAPEQLREAVAVVGPAHVAHLRDEFGAHDRWASDCAAFQATLAEFAEMTRQERERDFPQSVRHLQTCESCREMYWDVAGVWTVHSARAAGPSRKALAGPICLQSAAPGGLEQVAFGPPEMPRERIAAGADDEKVWALDDGDAGVCLELIVAAQAEDDWRVQCRVRPEPGSSVDPAKVRIEVREANTGAEPVSGPLRNFEKAGFRLFAGSWQVRLMSEPDEPAYTWDIPLELVSPRGRKPMGRRPHLRAGRT
ncbi:MAG: hypothetical protein ACYS8K_04035 [Planctomycetota bacterium]|jgi:hypothetical protein